MTEPDYRLYVTGSNLRRVTVPIIISNKRPPLLCNSSVMVSCALGLTVDCPLYPVPQERERERKVHCVGAINRVTRGVTTHQISLVSSSMVVQHLYAISHVVLKVTRFNCTWDCTWACAQCNIGYWVWSFLNAFCSS